jgi:3-oxoacyl-[acyl-carrier protein] reductase
MTESTGSLPLLGLRTAVLGSTSGIGRATALQVARAGADVIVHGRTSRQAAEDLVDEIRSLGRRSEFQMADLADPIEGDRLVDRIWNTWNGIDAWIHFAGADTLTGPNASLDYDSKLELLWRVDVVSTIRLCRNVGHRMVERGAGAIVTMGWDQAETGMEGDSGELFGATKGAVMAFTRSLALSLSPTVRVNAVAPGWIQTAWGESASSAWNERVLSETPLRRWGRPDDVARVAAFIIEPGSSYLTGQVVRVNGGAIR